MMFHRRQGLVLILVIAILGLLALLAIQISKTSHLSQQVTLEGVHLTQSRLAARSGLEKALSAARQWAWRPWITPPFEQNLRSCGDDRNRNGMADLPEEDPAGVDDFRTTRELRDDLTPSLALAENPAAPEPRSLILNVGGTWRGVSWLDQRHQPSQASAVRVNAGHLDLNSGVLSGHGEEGSRHQTINGQAYSSSDLGHPFNRPLVNFLNAWGNYFKYESMVRPSRSYDWTRDVDDPANLASYPDHKYPVDRFDEFNPSGNHPEVVSETPLGDLLIAARPENGWDSLQEPLDILKTYIESWVDRDGASGRDGSWTYRDGTSIPLVTPKDILSIQVQFINLATLGSGGQHLVLPVRRLPPAAGPHDPNDQIADHVSDFAFHDKRDRFNVEFYKVDHRPVNVNTAPRSALAAVIHGIRDVQIYRYAPSEKQPDDIMKLTDPLAYQSENGYPVWSSYGFTHQVLAGKPLLSMTESLRLADDLILARQSMPLDSFKRTGETIRDWRQGYDAKDFGVRSPMTRSIVNHLKYFYDDFQGGRRVQLLAYLLNPDMQLPELTIDESHPGAVDHRLLALGSYGATSFHAAGYGGRPLNVRFFFSKLLPHEFAGPLTLNDHDIEITSEGFTLDSMGNVLASSVLSTRAQPFTTIRISAQSEFEAVARDPGTGLSTLGLDWISYPEAPGVSPSPWEGRLALKPRLRECPWGDGSATLRVPLSAYEPQPTTTEPAGLWPKGPRTLEGPSPNPARGKMTNSLNPGPGEAIPSLLPGSTTEIDTVSDLMPGGGIRVSPWNNSSLYPFGNASLTEFPTRQEALLVLRNVKTSDSDEDQLPDPNHDPGSVSRVLPNFHEGAVSFYFKPTITPASCYSTPRLQCLFYTHFVIRDEETFQRGLSLGLPAAESERRSTFIAQLRLMWGPYENLEHPANQIPEPWPFVPGFAGFGGQIGSGAFLFDSMRGFQAPDGSWGHVLGFYDNAFGFNTTWTAGSDGHEFLYGGPNPYCAERIYAEFMITKYGMPSDNYYHPHPGWPVWDSEDDLPPLAQSTLYDNGLSTPLHLFDTSAGSKPEMSCYHTVRKVFLLSHPFRPTGPDIGTAPRDTEGFHQPLVAPGRWNHILFAWRDLYSLLDNQPLGHRGGCLAAWVNGSWDTTVNGYKTSALFFTQDFSEGFEGKGTYGSFDTMPWSAPNEHPVYEQPPYNPNSVSCKSYLLPEFSTGTLNGSDGPFLPVPYFFEWTGPTNSNHSDILNTRFSSYSMSRSGLSPGSSNKRELHNAVPSRFYFGSEPHVFSSLHSGSPLEDVPFHTGSHAWGSMMDIQIFPRAHPDILAADGSFQPTLNGFSDFSPYSNDNTLKLWPLLDQNPLSIKSLTVSVYLPRFHEFWDDQNTSTAGPDPDDVQQLTARLEHATGTLATLTWSQEVGTTDISSWNGSGTDVLVKKPSDLSLDFTFSGPEVTMSTPLIEDIVILGHHQNTKLTEFRWMDTSR